MKDEQYAVQVDGRTSEPFIIHDGAMWVVVHEMEYRREKYRVLRERHTKELRVEKYLEHNGPGVHWSRVGVHQRNAAAVLTFTLHETLRKLDAFTKDAEDGELPPPARERDWRDT